MLYEIKHCAKKKPKGKLQSTKPKLIMWNQGKTLVIITGASRGLGQAISVQMAQHIANPTLVLISRAIDDLKISEKLCKENNEKSQVILGQMDLNSAKLQDFNNFLDKSVNFKEFESLVLVHNAGSLGNQGTKIVDFEDGDQIQAYWYLNVTSVMLLNSAVNKRHNNQFCSFFAS